MVMYLQHVIEPMFVIWAYLLQSVFMGAQFAIHALLRESIGGFFPLKKHSTTFFFIIHYGGFHAVYFIFLVIMSTDMDIDALINLIKYVKYTAWFLLVNLVLFTIRELTPSAPTKITPSIFMAYFRIIPIHLVIILGMNSQFVIDSFIVFMLLKLIFDVILYILMGGEARLVGDDSVE